MCAITEESPERRTVAMDRCRDLGGGAPELQDLEQHRGHTHLHVLGDVAEAAAGLSPHRGAFLGMTARPEARHLRRCEAHA